MMQISAFFVAHESVEAWPMGMDEGSAAKVISGGGVVAFFFTSTLMEAPLLPQRKAMR
jgi:hypothetical protein